MLRANTCTWLSNTESTLLEKKENYESETQASFALPQSFELVWELGTVSVPGPQKLALQTHAWTYALPHAEKQTVGTEDSGRASSSEGLGDRLWC